MNVASDQSPYKRALDLERRAWQLHAQLWAAEQALRCEPDDSLDLWEITNRVGALLEVACRESAAVRKQAEELTQVMAMANVFGRANP